MTSVMCGLWGSVSAISPAPADNQDAPPLACAHDALHTAPTAQTSVWASLEQHTAPSPAQTSGHSPFSDTPAGAPSAAPRATFSQWLFGAAGRMTVTSNDLNAVAPTSF